jgi:23S rRNA pseudouridine1911/1915/1917 synthase
MATLRFSVAEADAGSRLDRALAARREIESRSLAERLLREGAVRVDGQVQPKSHKLEAGALVEVELPGSPAALEPEPVTVEIRYEDEYLVVLDKPAGLTVHPGAGERTGTLAGQLLSLGGAGGPDPDRPGIVHRLDKGTSGLLLVARSARAYDALVAMLSARAVDRRYRALVWGIPESPTGLVDAPVGRSSRDRTRMAVTVAGRDARTRYEVVRAYHEPVEVTELACRLETGRTHQIRVHLRSIGHPVVGDARYGGDRQSLPVARPFLHAGRLGLDHPVTGEPLTFTSPLPGDLAAVLARLR